MPDALSLSLIYRYKFRRARHDCLDASRTTALANFAAPLTRDQDAVMAALSLPSSNGPVEGPGPQAETDQELDVRSSQV